MCFSLPWLQQLLIYLVVVCAVVGIIKLLIPFVLAQLGAGGTVVAQAINIVLWAVIAIFVIYICFALIACLVGAGGFSLLPHR